MKYLLDTNVLSESYNIKCDKNVESFINSIQQENMFVSVISIGELCYGVEKLPSSKKKHDLSIWLYSKIPEWFKNRIIPVENELALKWGNIKALTKRTLSGVDSLIAATAIFHNMFLVTRNTKDFDDIEGINLLNPWEYLNPEN